MITGSGRHNVGDSFDRFFLIGVIGRLIGVIGRLEDGTGCGGLQLMLLFVGSCEEFLEACPDLVVTWMTPPYFVVVIEEPGLEQELVGNCDDLGRGIGRVSGGGVVHRIFNLINKGFEVDFCLREPGVACRCFAEWRRKCLNRWNTHGRVGPV